MPNDTHPKGIELRRLTAADAIRPIEQVQREVWGFDDVEVVPLHVLLTTARHGGLILGAYAGDRIVGFSFGYLGTDVDGTPVLCSHLLAVVPDMRGTGVGVALKWAQRDAALAQGIDRIVWTFDPLEHGNARLNLTRLGGVSDRYLVDLYGELRDELNAGLPTDRIEVVWDLRSERVERARTASGVAGDAPAGPLVDPDGPGGDVHFPEGAPHLRVRALEHAQTVRKRDPHAALAWRKHLRSTLLGAFTRGYLLIGAGRGAEGAEYRLALRDEVDVSLPRYPVVEAGSDPSS